MNFSKLKLTEMLATGAGTGLSTSANNKASQAAQASKQVSSTTNSIGAQTSQMSAKPSKANVASPVQQRTQAAPSPVATKTGPQTVVSSVDYFDMLRTRKEYVKQLAEKTSDWRQELTEKLGVDDEVFHPYVEVMPHGDFKLKDAQKKALMAAKKEKEQGTLGEEVLDEAKKSKTDDKKKEPKPKKKKTYSDELDDPRLNPYRNKLRKASKNMHNSRQKARSLSKKAKEEYKKQHAALDRGDEKARSAHSKRGKSLSDAARAAKAENDKYIPYGSRTYSKAGKPSEMNNKYFRDRESDKGRQRIALRSMGL